MPLTMQTSPSNVMETPSNYKKKSEFPSKVNQYHDNLFKETFGDLEVTRDFFKNYLPEEILGIIDVETIETRKDSFIEEELKDVYADLLFSAKLNDEDCYLNIHLISEIPYLISVIFNYTNHNSQ